MSGDAVAGSFGASALGASSEPSEAGPKAVVLRSAFDTVFGVVARRSEAAARIVRESPSAVDAMKSVVAWVARYLDKHQLQPHEIVVRGSMTPEGAVVLRIERPE